MYFAKELLAAASVVFTFFGGAISAGEPVPIGDSIPSLKLAPFMIGQASASKPDRERSASIDGTDYAVVAPLYLGGAGGGGMISYLRLFNGGAATATFSVKVVGSPTGRDYGDAIFQVSPGATRQLALFQVLQAASATPTEPDTNFSFYIRSTEPLAGYQHVTHSPAASYFENSAVCRASIQEVVREATNEMVLSSVHTSQLAAAGYPASIELHNYANSAIVYRLTVKDESSGLNVGQMNVTAEPHASYTIPWSQIESTIDWTPMADQIRVNLVVTDPSGAPPAILLGQTIINNALEVTLNMTTMCAVNVPDSGVQAARDVALPPVISTIIAPTETPIDSTARPLGEGPTYHTFNNPRSYGFGDLRGTGRNDIVFAPTFSRHKPEFPIQIWANLGDGRFENQTAQLIAGEIPIAASAMNVFVHDFDHDGRADIFIVDAGLEDTAPTDGFTGGRNVYLTWGSDGKLHDRSSELPDNSTKYFHHVSSMADVNGDGHMDIVLTRLGGIRYPRTFPPQIFPAGPLFLLNDGNGNFTQSTAGIPIEVAYPISRMRADTHFSGSASVCDMNGDGRGDLITASYGNDDVGGGRTIRVHARQADGTYIETARIPMAEALINIPYNPGAGTGHLGGAQINCGRLAGSGRNDLLVRWEGGGGHYAQIMRNDGNFAFTDITTSVLGKYEITYPADANLNYPIGRSTVEDFDGDGSDDIVFYPYGVKTAGLTGDVGFIFLNNGAGTFSPWKFTVGGESVGASDVIAATGCDYCSFVPLIFDAGGSAHKDLVLLNFERDVTAGPRIIAKSIDVQTYFIGGSATASSPLRAAGPKFP